MDKVKISRYSKKVHYQLKLLQKILLLHVCGDVYKIWSDCLRNNMEVTVIQYTHTFVIIISIFFYMHRYQMCIVFLDLVNQIKSA